MVRFGLTIVSLALLTSTAPAFAQAAPQQQPASAKSAYNPNQVICEKEEETGSRLSSHKICHTRAQWDEMRRDDRSATEHIQMQRGMSASGG